VGALLATYDYLDSIGGMAALADWERELGERVMAGFPDGTQLYGLPTMSGRVPTFLINFPGVPSALLSEQLAENGFGVWSHGSYYALGLHERIGWGEALRVGLAHYNTVDEMDRFNEVLGSLVARHRRPGSGAGGVSAQPGGASVQILLDTGAGGPGLVRRRVEVPPGSSLSNAAGEAGDLWFVIDGTGTLEVDGQPPTLLLPDRALRVPANLAFRMLA